MNIPCSVQTSYIALPYTGMDSLHLGYGYRKSKSIHDLQKLVGKSAVALLMSFQLSSTEKYVVLHSLQRFFKSICDNRLYRICVVGTVKNFTAFNFTYGTCMQSM